MTAQRAMLKVAWGPRAGQKRVLTPGSTLRVGRLPPSDWELGHDAHMSAEHFELTWDGENGKVVDLGSAEGTFVSGEPAAVRPLGRRAWIRAGETDFTFVVEGATLRTPEQGGPSSPRVLEALDAERLERRLFALVDASRGDRVFELLETSIDTGRSLYEGYEGVALERSAPFLVELEPSSALLERLVTEGWTRGFATYFTSYERERDLRRHFRRFLFVEAEGIDGRVYFRFYDPRVLREFSAIATPLQLRELGRPVDAWWLPAADGSLLRIPGAARETDDITSDET